MTHRSGTGSGFRSGSPDPSRSGSRGTAPPPGGARHAYVDESKRGPYLMCAFVTDPGQRGQVAAVLNQIRKPGAPRIHMKNESDSTRRAVLSALSDLQVQSTMFVSRIKPMVTARAAIIEDGIWPHIRREQITRLILEPEAGQDERDRRQLYQLAQRDKVTDLSYDHLPPITEPMLWVPDAIAWAYGAGGNWRQRAYPVITQVIDIA